MAIIATHLTTDRSLTDGTEFTTASISPASNALVLLLVRGRRSNGLGSSPTVSGNGLTWVEIVSVGFELVSTGWCRLSLFRAMGVSPSSGTVSINYSGGNLNCCFWSIVQFEGVDTSGTNGSGAVIQSATNAQDSGTTLTVTLSAFSDPGNATYGGFSISKATEAINPGSGFTEFAEAQGTGTSADSGTIQSEYLLGNDTSVDASWATSANDSGGIAVEIKAALAAAVPWDRPQQFSQLLAQ